MAPQKANPYAEFQQPAATPDPYAEFQQAAPAPAPVGQTAMARAVGDHPLSDVGSTVLSHLKNLVSGPYHAFADAPKNADEQQIKGTNADTGAIGNAVGQFGLGAARMFVQPTRTALHTAMQQIQAGNTGMQDPYDKQGNYTPTAPSAAMDAIPVAGGLARQIANDAHQHGALAALAGAGVDLGAPVVAGKMAAGIQSMAPSVAEGAMSVGKRSRAYGKTPGRALLDETSGFSPDAVTASADQTLSKLTPQVNQMAASNTQPFSMNDAIARIDDEIAKAGTQNNATGIEQLQRVRDALTKNATTGLPLSATQTAEGALNLKRGIRNQFVSNYNPDAISPLTKSTAQAASGVIDSGLDQHLGPQFQDLNQRISSLIDARDAAESASRNAAIPQQMASRLKAKSGALAAALSGGFAGHEAYGVPGALLGTAAGLTIPELIGSPTAQMALARFLNSKISAIPPASVGGVLTPRSNR